MKRHIFFPAAAALVLGLAAAASAEDKAGSSSAVSANALTREQFNSLPPDTVITIDGARVTKRAFIESRTKAAEQAINKMHNARAKIEASFAAQRKAFLDGETAKLEEANRTVEAEIARLVAADAAAHGPNWEARKNEAAALLKEAATAPPDRRSQLEKKASDMLSPTSPPQ